MGSEFIRYVAALAGFLAVCFSFVVAWVAVYAYSDEEPGAVTPRRGWE